MVMSLIESLTRIKNAVYGREVREAIHDGIFRANQIADGANTNSDNTQIRQDTLEINTAQSVAQMKADKDAVIANATVDSEVILARGGKATLGQRLDDTTAQLDQTADEVKNLDNNKAEKSALSLTNQNLVSGLNSKVDKGGNEQVTMPMLAQDIKKAINDGVWDVNINTSDITNGAVTGDKLADGSATSAKRTVVGEYGVVVGAYPAILDYDTQSIRFSYDGGVNRVIYRGETYRIPDNTTVFFDDDHLDSWGNVVIVWFNIKTKQFSVHTVADQRINEDIIYLGTISRTNKAAWMNGSYHYIGDTTKSYDNAIVLTRRPVEFDFVNRKVSFFRNTVIKSKSYAYTIDNAIVLDIPPSLDGNYFNLAFDPQKKEFVFFNGSISGDTRYSTVAIFNTNLKEVHMNGAYLIDKIGGINPRVDLPRGANIFARANQIIIPAQTITVGYTRQVVPYTTLTHTGVIGDTITLYYDYKNMTFGLVRDLEIVPESTSVIVSFIVGQEWRVQGNYRINGYQNYSAYSDILTNNLEDAITSWWVYPLAKRHIGKRDKFYLSYTDSQGYKGVASVDQKTGEIVRKRLHKLDADDHNAVAVDIMPDGRIITAYAGGHNSDKVMHVRLSSSKESVVDFDAEILIQASGVTTYAQLFRVADKWVIFFRIDNTKWAYTSSIDAVTWTAPVEILSAGMQYYIRLQYVSDSNSLLRMIMYSNPNATDTNIRMGFFDASVMEMQLEDGSSVGTSGATHTDFPVIIPVGSKRNRLLDVAVTKKETTEILYAQYSNATDGQYYIYENEINTPLTPTGRSFYLGSVYVNGGVFKDSNSIILSKDEAGTDKVELWEKSGANWSKTKDVYSDTLAIRPALIQGSDSVVVQTGYYNENDYTDFLTDFKIVDIYTPHTSERGIKMKFPKPKITDRRKQALGYPGRGVYSRTKLCGN